MKRRPGFSHLTILAALLLCGPALAATFGELRAKFQREKDGTYMERIETVRAIAALGTERALKFLIQVAEKDADQSIRLNTVHSIGRIALPAAQAALVRFYDEGDSSMKSTVFSVLSNSRKEPLPKRILDEALSSDQQGARSNAIRYLGKAQDDRFEAEAKRFMTDFPTGAASLIYALAQYPTPGTARMLIAIYDDTRQQDRDRVPALFVKAEEPILEVLLEEIAESEGESLCRAAVIAGRGPVLQAERVLVRALPEDPESRSILIEAIGRIGAKTDVGQAALLTALGEKNEVVATAAVRAIRETQLKAAIPVLIELLARTDGVLRSEVRISLERITGQQLGFAVHLWQSWWKDYGGEFDPTKVPERIREGLDQALVDLAIEKGKNALFKIQGKEPPWEYASHAVGTTALVVLALDAAGATTKDRRFATAVLWLLKATVPARTYEASIMAMALSKVEPKRGKRKIAECAKFLVGAQLDHGMWGYPTGDGDNSNTQYAVLGLRAAAKAGIRIPQKTWEKARRHFLETRTGDGGWSYVRGNYKKGSASMTAAGIAALLVCLENMKLDEEEVAKTRAAIDEAFTALGQVMKLDKDQLYALYAIERAGILGRRSSMDKKPWYVPGAKRLVEEQGRDGHWRPGYNEPVQTAFAILFLKKATTPISTK